MRRVRSLRGPGPPLNSARQGQGRGSGHGTRPGLRLCRAPARSHDGLSRAQSAREAAPPPGTGAPPGASRLWGVGRVKGQSGCAVDRQAVNPFDPAPARHRERRATPVPSSGAAALVAIVAPEIIPGGVLRPGRRRPPGVIIPLPSSMPAERPDPSFGFGGTHDQMHGTGTRVRVAAPGKVSQLWFPIVQPTSRLAG